MNDENTKEFLLAEFSTSWQQIISIDVRRGTFFNYYNIAFLAVLTFAAGVLGKSVAPSLPTTIVLTVIFVFLVRMGDTVMDILKSERRANVRYRNKINLIRETFLSDIDDPKIQFYLQQKDIGITDFTNDRLPADSIGGTLKRIFKLIELERYALIALIVLIWLGFLFLPEAAPTAIDTMSKT